MTPAELAASREAFDLSVAEFAAAIGVGRNQAYKWERGDAAIPRYVEIIVEMAQSSKSAARVLVAASDIHKKTTR
jgi:transcriptional regulator with XRE-family HTH domain